MGSCVHMYLFRCYGRRRFAGVDVMIGEFAVLLSEKRICGSGCDDAAGNCPDAPEKTIYGSGCDVGINQCYAVFMYLWGEGGNTTEGSTINSEKGFGYEATWERLVNIM